MVYLFEFVSGLLKIDSVCIDNRIFGLHYKATVIVLIFFSLIVICQQHLGNPIECIMSYVSRDYVGTYCWMHSLYEIKAALSGMPVKDWIKHQKIYQWVYFILLLQAVLFYVPRYLWKIWEGGRIKMLVSDLKCPNVVSENFRNDQKKRVIDYLVDNMHTRNLYAYLFFACEGLNFINVTVQTVLMDSYLGFSQSNISEIMELDAENRTDPMSKVFPQMTACVLRKVGASGVMQIQSGICSVPLNITHEYIYIFIWYWFLILSTLTGIALLLRCCSILVPKLRRHLLKVQCDAAISDQIDIVAYNCDIGDWFLLNQLGKNLDSLAFKEVIVDMVKKFEDDNKIYPDS